MQNIYRSKDLMVLIQNNSCLEGKVASKKNLYFWEVQSEYFLCCVRISILSFENPALCEQEDTTMWTS